MTSESTANQVPVAFEDSLPGAFPETPAEESGPPQHNKLHKRDDPRGFADSDSTPRSHGHADSGVSAVSGASSTPSSSAARGGNYTYEKNGLPDRTRVQDPASSSVPQQQTTGTSQPHASHEQGASKPGFMTGAYSRVGNNSNNQQQPTATNDSAARQPTNANPLSSSSHVQRDPATASPDATSTSSSGRHIHIMGGDPATVAGGAAAASAVDREGTSSNSPSSLSEEGQQQQQRNLVRNGRGRSEVDHEEAYWGDIPRGAGVYNTVVGAGSDEKNPATAHPHDRALPHAPAQHLAARDGTSASNPTPQWRNEGVAGNGVHNTVIGTGSDEDRSSVGHHREFPLASSSTQHDDNATGAAHHGDSTKNHAESPSSRFHEHLAEAGVAGAGTGYAADKYAHGHEGHHSTATSGVSPSQSQQQQQQYSSKPSTQEHLSELPGSQPEEERHGHHLGRDAALAGAGAGAAGYGAHKYASRDDNEKQAAYPHNDASAYQTGNPYSGENTSSVPSTGQNSTYLKYGPAGTAAATTGAAGYGANKSHDRDFNATSSQQHHTSSAGYTNTNDSYAHKDLSAVPEIGTATTTHGTDNDSHFGRNAALAGAGAGAAGYGAHKYAHRDDDNVSNAGYVSQPQQQAPTTSTSTRHGHGHGQQPTVTTGTEQRTVPAESSRDTQSDRHHHNDAKYAVAGVGTGAGAAAAYNAKRDHATPTTAAGGAQQQQAGTYNKLSDGTPSGVNLDRSSQNSAAAPTTTSTTNTTSSSPRGLRKPSASAGTAAPDTYNNNSTSHTGSKAAAATAAAGAGAYAAHDYAASGHKQQSSPATQQPQSQSQSHSRQHNASVSSHSSVDSSHGGQYNVLASGTPSGINISGDPHHHESPQTLQGSHGGSKARDTVPSPARYQ
ncbi:hypothetical protein SLS62_002404 [Diatrype stigma]|uniref:Uncharacterized protein n=1 Tax=Diatrype stigma TaxID=117547 RepID=A0AAN9UUE5_9PEZI